MTTPQADLQATHLMRARNLAVLLAVLLIALAVISPAYGTTSAVTPSDICRSALAMCGLGEPLEPRLQTIAELRLYRMFVTVAVGAALALSGGLMQGVFRNDLASPSMLGVSSGASLGAAIAVLALGGYGPLFLLQTASAYAPIVVCGAAFLGAITVTALVTLFAASEGRVSVPTLLLLGIALNAICGGTLFAIQAFVLDDFEVTRALITWSFGTLNDRVGFHAVLILIAVLLAAAVLPFVRTELDLFAGGEEDAQALGVDTTRVKLLALGASTLAASVAVAVAGNIAFVGLVVPHVLRLISERSHKSLLPMCLLGGPVFLLGTDLLQRIALPGSMYGPGVTMSLVGGPFFLYLLLRNRKAVRTW